jgi:hypothetical protein
MVAKELKHGLMTQRPQATQGHEQHQMGAHAQHGSEGAHDKHALAFAPTRPQIAAMTGIATLMLLAGLILPGLRVNLALGAKDVGGLVMPPGMIMDFNTSAEAMRDMSAVHPRHAATYPSGRAWKTASRYSISKPQ